MQTGKEEDIPKGVNTSGEKTTVFKKLRAKVCHHCPLCNHARNSPDSAIGRILHHKYHAENCPLWKAEKEAYGEGKEMNSPKVKALMLWKAF